MIIALEGMDAAGKQTHSKMLAEELRATRFSFPNYDSPTGQAIHWHLTKQWACLSAPDRTVVSGDVQKVLDARVFQALQAVNRLELLPEISARIASKQDVVFDRYWQSAYVYGTLDGLDEPWLRLVQERPMPPADINILLDVPVEEGFKRRPERRDRYEMNREFLERVRLKYIELWGAGDLIDGMLLWQTRPGWFYVDGVGGVMQVHERIMQIVKRARGVL